MVSSYIDNISQAPILLSIVPFSRIDANIMYVGALK